MVGELPFNFRVLRLSWVRLRGLWVIVLTRVAANGAAPPGARNARDKCFLPSTPGSPPRGPRRADFARWGGSVGLFADRTRDGQFRNELKRK